MTHTEEYYRAKEQAKHDAKWGTQINKSPLAMGKSGRLKLVHDLRQQGDWPGTFISDKD